jgi:hypothetical protein
MESINSNEYELSQDRSSNIHESQIDNSFTYRDWMVLSAGIGLIIYSVISVIVGIKEIITCLG